MISRSLLAVTVALASCGPIEDSSADRAARETARDPRTSGGESSADVVPRAAVAPVRNAIIRINEDSERDASAVRAQASNPFEWSNDGGPMVTADAGPRAAELAWLVTRIDENADTAGPAGPPNVRALASYGADGVRVLVSVFRSGDARRAPHARRVIELVAQRSCRVTADRMAPRRLIAWIESGSTSLSQWDGGAWPWSRSLESSWPGDAAERLRAWADRGAPCDMTAPQRARDAGQASVGMDAGVALLDARAP
ncbi:MAG: hypothetical protein JNK05_34210 [Myxococcales bacterium]|nr:hypothetical protein [Myxococcales bacterium]